MSYNADSIEQLTFREGCRKRIGIYLGSADMTGVIAGFLELVNNATDEGLICPTARKIVLCIGKDWASCRDYGRGMPHGPNKFSKEVMINLLTENHSGAKFDDNAYGGKSRGLNGTGSAATCCSSDWFEISSYRDGAHWFMRFEEGKPCFSECQKLSLNGEEQGTYIKYKPSQEVFNAEKIEFNYEDICKIIKEYSYFNKGIQFQVKNEETGEVRVFVSENGLIDFAKEHISNPVHPSPIHLQLSENDIDIELILQWTKNKERFYLFSNGGENPNGGTPITGIKTAITNYMKKQFKGGFDGDMARTGLTYICSVNLKNPIYDGQVKSKITNPELKGLAQRATGAALSNFQEQHPDEFKAIIDFLSKERKAEQAAERAREAVLTHTKEINAAAKKKVLMADKLKDAEFLGEDATLLIVEGDSAAGAIIQGRDVDHYGLLPIRGKCINALSNPMEDVLANEEVKAILMAMGITANGTFNPKKLRYGKLGICVDADDDGAHIALLVTALVYSLCPEFVLDGRLCWLKAPLYKVTSGGKVNYYFNDSELPKGVTGEITRYKGLGEMKPEDVENAMFGKYQRLEQIEPSEEGLLTLEKIMGKDVQPRKDFVFNNIDFSTIEV